MSRSPTSRALTPRTSLAAARILLAHGADPSVRNGTGQTRAGWARLTGLDEAADLMDAPHNSALFSRN
jgi:hypothetical protein